MNYLKEQKITDQAMQIIHKLMISLMVMLVGCSSGNNGNNNNPEQVAAIQTIANQYFESYSATHGFSAIGITAECNGFNNSQPVTVFDGTMGYPNIDSRLIQNNSIWQIGSISKSFASIVLLQLASNPQYNFSLDDLITKWLPEYNYYTWPNGNVVPTIRQIMNMTSGIPNDATESWLSNYLNNLYSYMSPETMIATYATHSLNFQPGTSYNYSDTGYQMLGLLIKKITGNTANTEITNRIIKPLGLHNTYFVDNLPTNVVASSQLVHGYAFTYESEVISHYGQDLSQASLSGQAFIAGNIISTPIDINTYYRVLFSTNLLLNSQQFQELSSLVSIADGQSIENPSTSSDGVGYGLGISALSFATGLSPFTPGTQINLQNYPNIWANLNKYRYVYYYEGGPLGFMFNSLYNPANSASVTVTVNSGYDNAAITTEAELSILNYLDPICNTTVKY